MRSFLCHSVTMENHLMSNRVGQTQKTVMDQSITEVLLLCWKSGRYWSIRVRESFHLCLVSTFIWCTHTFPQNCIGAVNCCWSQESLLQDKPTICCSPDVCHRHQRADHSEMWKQFCEKYYHLETKGHFSVILWRIHGSSLNTSWSQNDKKILLSRKVLELFCFSPSSTQNLIASISNSIGFISLLPFLIA